MLVNLGCVMLFEPFAPCHLLLSAACCTCTTLHGIAVLWHVLRSTAPAVWCLHTSVWLLPCAAVFCYSLVNVVFTILLFDVCCLLQSACRQHLAVWCLLPSGACILCHAAIWCMHSLPCCHVGHAFSAMLPSGACCPCPAATWCLQYLFPAVSPSCCHLVPAVCALLPSSACSISFLQSLRHAVI